MSHNNLSGAPAPASPLLTHTSHLFLPTQFLPPVAPFLPHLHSQVACQLSQVAPRQPFVSRTSVADVSPTGQGCPTISTHHRAAGLSNSLVLQGLSLPPAPSFSPQASWVRGPAGPQGSDPFPTSAPGGIRACHSPVCHQRAGQHEEGEQARQNQGRDVANWKVEREQSGRSGPGGVSWETPNCCQDGTWVGVIPAPHPPLRGGLLSHPLFSDPV